MTTSEGENLGFLRCFGKFFNSILQFFAVSISAIHILSLLWRPMKDGCLSGLTLLDGDQSVSERLPTWSVSFSVFFSSPEPPGTKRNTTVKIQTKECFNYLFWHVQTKKSWRCKQTTTSTKATATQSRCPGWNLRRWKVLNWTVDFRESQHILRTLRGGSDI